MTVRACIVHSCGMQIAVANRRPSVNVTFTVGNVHRNVLGGVYSDENCWRKRYISSTVISIKAKVTEYFYFTCTLTRETGQCFRIGPTCFIRVFCFILCCLYYLSTKFATMGDHWPALMGIYLSGHLPMLLCYCTVAVLLLWLNKHTHTLSLFV